MSTRQTILVLAPHPDDETFGCGGTIRLLTQGGASVDVLYLTQGELGFEAPEVATLDGKRHLAEVRAREAQEACRILGVRQAVFLDGADGNLAGRPDLSDKVYDQLARERYQRVFCPGPQERHPDHLATFRILQNALRRYEAGIHIWLYEVWTPLLQPNTLVPIDGTMEFKIAAIRAHRSQLACLDYLSAFRGLAAYRSLFCPDSVYAEAFLTGDAQAFLRPD